MFNESGEPFNLTATGNVGAANRAYQLLGFYVNSTNVGTLVLKRGGSSGTAISGTITPAAGTYHKFPADCPAGLHATIAGTALDVTFFVVPVG